MSNRLEREFNKTFTERTVDKKVQMQKEVLHYELSVTQTR